MSCVVFLTNFVPPYRVPFFERLRDLLGRELEIVVSTAMEEGRSWETSFGSLKVHSSRTWTFRRPWRHPHGFTEPNYIHVPYDTILSLLRLRPQVIVTAEMGLRSWFSAVYARLFAPGVRPKLIVWATLSEHTERGRSGLRTWLRRQLLRLVDEVVVNGDSGKRYVESLGFPSHRIFPIHQATDLSTFYVKRPEAMSRRLDRGLTKWRLIYSGRCIDLKGLQGFFEQLLTVAQADSGFQVNWTLCGEGPVAAELEERLRQEPESLRERVFLECLGSVAYSKLADVYAQADTLVLPTLSDEWGLVVNEALAMGIPVLGSRYSQAVMELIEPGKNGWIFDPLRAEDVREKIREAYHARGSIQFSSWENFEKTLQAWVKRLKLPEN